MNYVSIVYVVVVVLITIDWFARGRRDYQGTGVHEEINPAVGLSVITATEIHSAPRKTS